MLKELLEPTLAWEYQLLGLLIKQVLVVYKHVGVINSTEELIELTNKYLKVSI
jgi:hypothetical protein